MARNSYRKKMKCNDAEDAASVPKFSLVSFMKLKFRIDGKSVQVDLTAYSISFCLSFDRLLAEGNVMFSIRTWMVARPLKTAAATVHHPASIEQHTPLNPPYPFSCFFLAAILSYRLDWLLANQIMIILQFHNNHYNHYDYGYLLLLYYFTPILTYFTALWCRHIRQPRPCH